MKSYFWLFSIAFFYHGATGAANAQWAYRYADLQATGVLNLEEPESNPLLIPLIDSFSTPDYFTFFRAGDLDGDGISELAAVNHDQTRLYSIDFVDRSITQARMPDDIDHLELLFISDVDNDGAADAIVRITNEGARHSVYSFIKREWLSPADARFIPLRHRTHPTETIDSIMLAHADIDFDGNQKFIQLEYLADGSSLLCSFDMTGINERILIDLPHIISPDSFVLYLDKEFQETIFLFESTDITGSYISAYELIPGEEHAHLLWSQALREETRAARIAIQSGLETIPQAVISTHAENGESASFLSTVDIYTGEVSDSAALPVDDTLDLSVGDYDADGIHEIVMLTSDSNMRKIELDRGSSRIVTIQNAAQHLGGADFINQVEGLENVIVQHRSSGFSLIMLNQDFDPIFQPPSLNFEANAFSRGILGDFDDNHQCEAVIAAQTASGPMLYRVYMLDPSLPTSLAPPQTGILRWFLHEFDR